MVSCAFMLMLKNVRSAFYVLRFTFYVLRFTFGAVSRETAAFWLANEILRFALCSSPFALCFSSSSSFSVFGLRSSLVISAKNASIPRQATSVFRLPTSV